MKADGRLEQGPPPARPTGTRQWEELTVAEQDRLLLAAVHHTESMFSLAEEFDLKHGTAYSLFLRLHQLEQPALDRQQERVLERRALHQTEGTNLGERLKRAISRRDGQAVEGPEPPLAGRWGPQVKPYSGASDLSTPPRLASNSLRKRMVKLWQERGWNSSFVLSFLAVVVMFLFWGVEFFRLGYWLLAPLFGWPQIDLMDGPTYRP